MEVAGFVIGAVGLAGIAGLYSTCVQALDQIDTARHIEVSANALFARLEVIKHLLRVWGDNNGIQNGAMLEFFNPILNDEPTRKLVFLALATIENIMANQNRLTERYGLSMPMASATNTLSVAQIRDQMSNSRPRTNWRRRARWAITDKNKFSILVGELEAIVDRLYMLVPPRESTLVDDLSQLLENLKLHIDGELIHHFISYIDIPDEFGRYRAGAKICP